MNYNTEKIEAVLNGSPELLSTDDMALIIIDLVKRIDSLEDYVNGLSGEIQSLYYEPPSIRKAKKERKPKPFPAARKRQTLRVFNNEEQAKLTGGK